MTTFKSLLAVLSVVALTSAKASPMAKSKRQVDPSCALACLIPLTDDPAAAEACVDLATAGPVDPVADAVCPLDFVTTALALDQCACVGGETD
ncbi:hypothetical protein BU17DRAFT_89353 [Hysterangium stoloniferum]|nr:hypothetical protein BU17DRAFT_89353 [Hysterangium stoloniferum]